jgi:putative phage-type endonuclease
MTEEDFIDITDSLDISSEYFFNEEEHCEIYEMCVHLMEEFINDHPTLISEPDFEDIFDDNISELMYLHFDYDILYTEEAEEELEDIINHAKTDFFNYFMPPRSHSKSLILKEPNEQIIESQIKYLKGLPQPTQRTKEWYEFRNNLITASNAYKAFESQSVQNQLIYEKCVSNVNLNAQEETQDKDTKIIEDTKKLVNTNSPLHWGQKYEPLSVMIYEQTYKTKIGDFGCIPHNTFSFLGASPDGINVDKTSKRYGRMLEIKNIVNREIDGIPKKEYWIQMQLQMEVCNLDECDFLETRFIEYENEEEYCNDTFEELSETEDGEKFLDYTVSKDKKMKGIILQFQTKDCKPFYVYKPLDICHKEDIEDWCEETLNTYESEPYKYVYLKYIYWKLDQISCVLVQRNKQWFCQNIQQIENIWKIIEAERVKGYKHREPNRRAKKECETEVDDNKGYSCLLSFNKDKSKEKEKEKIVVIKSEEKIFVDTSGINKFT